MLAEIGPPPAVPGNQFAGRHGLFDDVDEAVAAAREAFEQLSERTMEDRKRIIDHIRRISIDQCVELGTMEMEETKIGRLDHKIEKLKTLGERTPGVEFLRSEVFSGDHGLAVIEHAPFGVIGAITPVTHSLPTITGNAISMIAAGNTLVVNPHPSGKRVAAEGVRRFNEAIYRDLGIDNLICVIAEPTLDSANAIFKHRDVALICVTGGPAVARAALNCGKRAIVAGPGNPPVVVDETADLDRAARCIIQGGGLRQQPAVHRRKRSLRRRRSLRSADGRPWSGPGPCGSTHSEIDRLTDAAIVQVGEGENKHDAPCQEFLGKDAAMLARAAGKHRRPPSRIALWRNRRSNPFVPVEQMMPFVPFVRCRDVDEAIAKAQALRTWLPPHRIIHSTNVRNMTKMGRRHGHHPVRQERPVHVRAGAGRRRLPVVLDRRPHGRRRHHAADVHPRAPLLDDRRPADPGKTKRDW